MKFLDNKDLGILIFRIGIGIAFILHGYPKIMGGVDAWTDIGSAMSSLGINIYPVFWGFMAALAEFGGGILLITGIFFRTAILGLLTTMIVATFMHFSQNSPFDDYAHSLELGIVLLSFLFIGAGKYKLQILLKR